MMVFNSSTVHGEFLVRDLGFCLFCFYLSDLTLSLDLKLSQGRSHTHTAIIQVKSSLGVCFFFSIVVSLFTHIPEISQSFCDIAESGSARCEKEIILYLPRIIKKIFC